ncbi:uncharacterized protein si:zfos-464b6.2 isoform X5 [Neoarius graeffei]|uniref:uncharacterized protein si:zfos-464b6.2 isoform X5 n=1 Tax=Neoarius graeffei TaxID=443677 RepID=UPI00298CF8BA|nr:uncharacterized protein si:zfos-464b6.2 isoform X5 [Neoarius graeffei]
MNMHTAAFRRAAQVSQQFVFPRTLFITVIVSVFISVFFFLTGLRNLNNYKPTAFYPHWKKKQPPLMACGVSVNNDPIVKVSNLKTYMVGSYIEHRHVVKMIQTIAIVLRSENTNYHCLLCCNGQNVSVPAAYEIHSDHFGFEYGTADITCEIPETCPTPTHVAITSPSPKENGSLLDVHAFQPVRNQQKLEVFPYEFTVCISTMFDFVNVLMLVQAMEMFKILGVQKVAIYKTSCDPVTQKVLDYYVRQNFVEIIPWHVSSYIKVSRDPRPEYSPDSWKKVTGVNILDHIYRLSNDPTKFNDFKVIVNPRLVFQTTVHGFLQSVNGSVRVNHAIARKYHLRNITNTDVVTHSRIQDTRLREFADRLIPAVSEVLRKALDIS